MQIFLINRNINIDDPQIILPRIERDYYEKDTLQPHLRQEMDQAKVAWTAHSYSVWMCPLIQSMYTSVPLFLTKLRQTPKMLEFTTNKNLWSEGSEVTLAR